MQFRHGEKFLLPWIYGTAARRSVWRSCPRGFVDGFRLANHASDCSGSILGQKCASPTGPPKTFTSVLVCSPIVRAFFDIRLSGVCRPAFLLNIDVTSLLYRGNTQAWSRLLGSWHKRLYCMYFPHPLYFRRQTTRGKGWRVCSPIKGHNSALQVRPWIRMNDTNSVPFVSERYWCLGHYYFQCQFRTNPQSSQSSNWHHLSNWF